MLPGSGSSTGTAWLYISLHPPSQHGYSTDTLTLTHKPGAMVYPHCLPQASLSPWAGGKLSQSVATIPDPWLIAAGLRVTPPCVHQHFSVCPVYLSAQPVDPARPINTPVAPEGTPNLGPATGSASGNHRQCPV